MGRNLFRRGKCYRICGKVNTSKHEDATDLYINEQFHKTLLKMIENEVNNQFSVDIKNNMSKLIKEEINVVASTSNLINKPKFLHNSNDSIENTLKCKGNDILISSLNSQIAFLRNELALKNKIIEMLFNERSYTQAESSRL